MLIKNKTKIKSSNKKRKFKKLFNRKKKTKHALDWIIIENMKHEKYENLENYLENKKEWPPYFHDSKERYCYQLYI